MVERLCRPLSVVLVNSTSIINKALVKKKYDLSVDELSKALELTSKEIPEEKEMLAEIIKFYNKTFSLSNPVIRESLYMPNRKIILKVSFI